MKSTLRLKNVATFNLAIGENMKNNLIIRKIKDYEIIDISRLHQKYYNDLRQPEVWYWEYKGINPEKSVLTIIKDKNEIVGTQGMIPIYLNICGKKWLTGKSESTLIDSQYRGKGLFVKFYNYAIDACKENGMVCIWGFTKAIETLKKVNYRIYKNTMKWAIMPLRFNAIKRTTKSYLKPNKKLFLFLILIGMGYLYSSMRKALKRIRLEFKSKYELTDTLKSMADVELLFDSLRKEHPELIHIHQDEKYINWRIYNNPFNKKITFFAYSGRALVGYIYLTIRYNKVELTDFTFKDLNAGLFLMQKLLDFFHKNKFGLASYSGNIKNPLNQQVFKLLKSFGFIVIKRSNEFILRNINYSNEKKLNNIKNWYINDLWSEGI